MNGRTPPAGIDTSVSHSARVWNYWLGGKDNYPVDHEAGDKFAAILPSIVDVARASRAFLVRAVQYLAGEAGIRQFLDVGTGLPPPTTPTKSPRRPRRSAASFTLTTIPWP
jgi:hypothetical protein